MSPWKVEDRSGYEDVRLINTTTPNPPLFDLVNRYPRFHARLSRAHFQTIYPGDPQKQRQAHYLKDFLLLDPVARSALETRAGSTRSRGSSVQANDVLAVAL